MNLLATTYLAIGRLDEALALHEQVLKSMKASLPANHPNTLTSMHNLAAAYLVAGRMEESIQLLEQTLKLRGTVHGPQHPYTLMTMNTLAVAYCDTKRTKKALPLLEEILKIRRVVLSSKHPATRQSMLSLGKSYLETKELDKAESVLREALELGRESEIKDWWFFDTLVGLGLVLGEQKKHEEAEPLLIEGCQELMKRVATMPALQRHRIGVALQHVVDFYRSWEKPEEAKRWQAELDKWKKATAVGNGKNKSE